MEVFVTENKLGAYLFRENRYVTCINLSITMANIDCDQCANIVFNTKRTRRLKWVFLLDWWHVLFSWCILRIRYVSRLPFLYRDPRGQRIKYPVSGCKSIPYHPWWVGHVSLYTTVHCSVYQDILFIGTIMYKYNHCSIRWLLRF